MTFSISHLKGDQCCHEVFSAIDYWQDFDIVVVTGINLKEDLIKLNDACRKAKAKFFCGDIIGFFGYSFSDLGSEHEYVEEVNKPDAEDETVDGDGPSKAKKAKTEESEEKVLVKKTAAFPTIKSAFEEDFSGLSARKLKRMDPSIFILHALLEFYSRENRQPSLQGGDDAESFAKLAAGIADKFGLAGDKIPPEIFPLLTVGEASPVAAIVGGVLAQEIIKAISNRDQPHKNFFIFNPLTSAGVVEKAG